MPARPPKVRGLAPADACQKRDQLVADGYTVIPEVFGEDLLQVLRDWSEDYFSRHQVDRRYRYQGSDVSVISPARWARGDIPTPRSGDKSERILSDPIVDQYLNAPGLQMACKCGPGPVPEVTPTFANHEGCRLANVGLGAGVVFGARSGSPEAPGSTPGGPEVLRSVPSGHQMCSRAGPGSHPHVCQP